MEQELSKELVDKIKGLKLAFTDKPQPELLIRIPNRNTEVDYEVADVTSEFTSLCPLNMTQPDSATLYIKYKPKKYLVELKSLKMYLASYRMTPIFHEEVPARILLAISALLEPVWLEVTGVFTVRGGIQTTVRAIYQDGTKK